jgi:hypothetical protein
MKSTYIVYETESLEVIAKIIGEDKACHDAAYDRYEKYFDKTSLYKYEMVDIASYPPIDPDDTLDPEDAIDPNELIETFNYQVIDADLYCASLRV